MGMVEARQKRELARQKIVAWAFHEGLLRGLTGLTYGHLEARTSVRKRRIWELLGHKDHLWYELVKEAEARFDAEILDPARDQPTPARRLVKTCELALALIHRGDAAALVVLTECTAPHDSLGGNPLLLADVALRLRERLEELAAQAAEEGQIRLRPAAESLAYELDALIRMAAWERRLDQGVGAVERSRLRMNERLRAAGAPEIPPVHAVSAQANAWPDMDALPLCM